MHPDILRRDEPMSRLSRAVMALCCLSVAGCAVSPTARPASSAAATESASPPSPIGAFPAISEAPLSDQVRAVLQAALEMPVEGGLVQAIAASVRVPGVGGWSGVAGDDGSGESTSVDAQFSIASVTKTVVAAQVLAFAEDGRIDLDQPISGYLPPDLGIDTNDASVRDMLAMRSGLAQIPDALLRQLLAEDPARPWSLDEMAPFLPGPVDAPGAVVSYNSVNYALLGAAIERVSGRSLSTELRHGVLADNALDRLIFQDEERPSGPVSPPGPIEGFPSGRELLDLGGGYLPTRAIATMAGAAGAMASDAASLARWGYLLYGGFVLRSDTLAAMIDISRGYGLGCHPIVESGLDGIGHSGSLPGYQSLLYADSSSGTIVAVLVSSSSWDPRVTGADLMRAVDGG